MGGIFMLHVEFLGMPGAGKSEIYKKIESKQIFTVAKKLDSLALNVDKTKLSLKGTIKNTILRALNHRYYKNQRSLFTNRVNYLTSFFATHTELTNFILNQLITRKIPSEHKEKVMKNMFRLFYTYEIFAKNSSSGDILVFDEGFLQKVITLFAYGEGDVSNNIIEKYLSLIPLPDMVVIVKADFETCCERIKYRDSGPPKRLLDLRDEEIKSFFKKCNKYIEYLSETLSEKKIRIVSIDNSCNDSGRIKTFVNEIMTNIYSMI